MLRIVHIHKDKMYSTPETREALSVVSSFEAELKSGRPSEEIKECLLDGIKKYRERAELDAIKRKIRLQNTALIVISTILTAAICLSVMKFLQ